MSDKGRLYQDTKMRPGLLGFTTNGYKMNKIVGVCSFRLFLTTACIQLTGIAILASLAS